MLQKPLKVANLSQSQHPVWVVQKDAAGRPVLGLRAYSSEADIGITAGSFQTFPTAPATLSPGNDYFPHCHAALLSAVIISLCSTISHAIWWLL